MGGSGSSRWGSYTPKTTVEQCYSLTVSDLNKAGAFNYHYITGWIGYPSDTFPDTNRFTVFLEIGYTESGARLLALSYWVNGVNERIEVPVVIQFTRPQFGGVRRWFTCPLSVNDEACGRRVGKLYLLPPGARYFGCRRCHDLVYSSSQEHDKTKDLFLRNPQALVEEITKPRHERKFKAVKAFLDLFKP